MSFSRLPNREQEDAAVASHLNPILEDFQEDMELAMQFGNTDAMLEMLSTICEQYLASRATGCRWVQPQCRGKATIKMRQGLTQAPPQKHGPCLQDTADTARTCRAKKLLRRTEEMTRKCFLRGAHAAANEPDAQELWRSTCQDAWHLIGPSAHDLNADTFPSMARLGELLRQAREIAQEEQQAAINDRQQRWKDYTRLKMDTTPRAVFDLIKDCEQCGITMLLRGDGSLTTTLAEVDELLRKEWLPIFRLYADSPPPKWEDFKARFGRHIPTICPMERTDLTPARLRETLMKMKVDTSLGSSNWTVGELRALPDRLLQIWCDLFHTVERTGHWPEALTLGLISPITKDATEPLTAANSRPITVMPVPYRLWASTRMRELIDWQEQWLSACISSFRPEKGCEFSWWEEALRVEHALLSRGGPTRAQSRLRQSL